MLTSKTELRIVLILLTYLVDIFFNYCILRAYDLFDSHYRVKFLGFFGAYGIYAMVSQFFSMKRKI